MKLLITQGQLNQYSDSLRARRSGDRIPVRSRFSAIVETGPGSTHPPIQCVPGLFPGRGVDTNLHQVPRLRKCRAMLLLPLWAFIECYGCILPLPLPRYLVSSILLSLPSCPQHPVLKHTVHPIRTGVLWRNVVW